MKIWAKTSLEIRIFWDGYKSTVPLGQKNYMSKDPVLLVTITLVLDRGELILNTFTYKKPINNTLKTKKTLIFNEVSTFLYVSFLFISYCIRGGGGFSNVFILPCLLWWEHGHLAQLAPHPYMIRANWDICCPYRQQYWRYLYPIISGRGVFTIFWA